MHQIKMEIACLCVLAYILYYYFNYKRLPIRSAAIFKLLLWAAVVNLVFDAVTVLTVSNIETVSPFVNRLCHQIFIGSLDIATFAICCYIRMAAGRRPSRSVWAELLFCLPLAVCLLMVLFAPLYYNTEAAVPYSYGPMADTCYISVGIYLCISLIYIIGKWKKISRQQREAIFPALLVMTVFSVYQFFTPTILASGVGLTLGVLGVFMAMENPREYLDKTGTFFNGKAFEVVAADRISSGKKFTVLVAACREFYYVKETHTTEEIAELTDTYGRELLERYGGDVYLPMEGAVAMLVSKESKAEQLQRSMKEFYKGRANAEIFYYTYGKEFQDQKTMLDLLVTGVRRIQWKAMYIDKKIGIKNRDGFEYVLEYLYRFKERCTPIWYFMIDMNNLKQINDTQGHLVGDRLIQESVGVLQQAFGEETDIFRIGGDEFAVLLFGGVTERIVTEADMENYVQKIRRLCAEKNAGARIPISFAMGYSVYRPESDTSYEEMMERADNNMYQEKAKMKAEAENGGNG